MRLKTRIALGALTAVTLALPAAAFPMPKLHLPFHKDAKQPEPETDTPATEKTAPEPKHRHTDGFPEKDKPGAQNQPQNEKTWWGDSVWKTNRSEDSWKPAQSK